MNICSTCQGIESMVQDKLTKNPEYLAKVNAILADEGLKYTPGLEIKNFLWILVEDFGLDRLKAMVTRPLKELRIGPFYGCYILRPSWDLGFDDPENPQSLERVIKAVGGEPVAYAGRTKCCGFPIILEKEAIAVAMAGTHMKEAKEQGADFMVTPCPLCHMSLDIYQDRAGRAVNRELHLPILHVPQLLGLAMGLPAKDLGLSHHVISVDSLLATLERRRTQPQTI